MQMAREMNTDRTASPDCREGSTFRACLAADLYRYQGRRGIRGFLSAYLWQPGFRFTFWLRSAAWLRGRPACKLLYWIAESRRRKYEIKYGISIPNDVRIGSGLYIGHFGGIAVSSDAVIGRYCNISIGVIIGKDVRGSRAGSPEIGDYLYLAPGAKVIGGIRIGNEVAVGANCVVTKDIDDRSVVVGVPGHVISNKGSREYIRWVLGDTRS